MTLVDPELRDFLGHGNFIAKRVPERLAFGFFFLGGEGLAIIEIRTTHWIGLFTSEQKIPVL